MRRVTLLPHAVQRLSERGANKADVIYAVRRGVQSSAKHGRTKFSHTFAYNRKWLGRAYRQKTVEAFGVIEPGGSVTVVTVIVKFH
jgi:hypothetical protein